MSGTQPIATFEDAETLRRGDAESGSSRGNETLTFPRAPRLSFFDQSLLTSAATSESRLRVFPFPWREFPIVAALLVGSALLSSATIGLANITFETTSAYHHIRVIDDEGVRTLSF